MKPPLGRMLHVECIDERGTLLLVEAVGRCRKTNNPLLTLRQDPCPVCRGSGQCEQCFGSGVNTQLNAEVPKCHGVWRNWSLPGVRGYGKMVHRARRITYDFGSTR